MKHHHLMNIALLAAYPVAWVAPLAEAGVVPWLSTNEISIWGGIRDLWSVDPGLSLLVAALAIAIPYVKTLLLCLIHRGWQGPLVAIEAVAKLSMADVFLVALYIVIVKGVGIGSVTPAWGLWLFTACVLASIWVGWRTRRLG